MDILWINHLCFPVGQLGIFHQKANVPKSQKPYSCTNSSWLLQAKVLDVAVYDGVCSKNWLQTARSWKIGGEMRRAIVVAVSCGSGFSVQFSMFPDALACPLRSQVGMPRLSVVIFFLLESALSFRNPETLCEALLGTCAITRQRFLSPIWHKLSVAHLPKFQARMYSTFLGSNCQIWQFQLP